MSEREGHEYEFKQVIMKGSVRFYAVNDQRKTAPKKGYSLRPLRLTTIDSRTLAQHVELDSHIDSARVEYVMASVAKQIRQLVLNGHKVEMGELGTIGLTCQGTGSEAEDEVSVKNNVKGLKFTFRPSVTLKEKLRTVKCELVVLDACDGRKHDENGAVLIESGKE